MAETGSSLRVGESLRNVLERTLRISGGKERFKRRSISRVLLAAYPAGEYTEDQLTDQQNLLAAYPAGENDGCNHDHVCCLLAAYPAGEIKPT